MRRIKKVTLLLVILLLVLTTNVKAYNVETLLNSDGGLEYTEEFKEYLNLTEEEKANTMMPRMYEIPYKNVEYYNPLKLASVKASSVGDKFNLKDIIPENVIVRDQKNTGRCWAFATLSSLETNLALKNYNKGITAKTYDFSEMHLDYAMSKTFENGVINANSFSRTVKPNGGGNWYISRAYLTNGTGAINENEMPFENHENTINIREIQGKTVTSQVYDTIEFASSTPTEITDDMINQIKNHIKNHGSVFASIHGASLLPNDCYNNETGALYCDGTGINNCKIDHGISIVGWNDDYEIENFNEEQRPSKKGAWIIKNSWGEQIETDLIELKKIIFEVNRDYFISININDAESVPNEYVELYGYTVEDDKAVMKVGNNGFMYISYEDINVYKALYGIVKASDYIDYENIYQYNYLDWDYSYNLNGSKIYVGNIFTKKTNGTEYLTQVGIDIYEGCTCKVYVNTKGTSMAMSDLQLVSLEAGSSEILEGAGYHTLEFSEPIEIESNNFVVVLEMQGTQYVLAETKIDGSDSMFADVEIESGKCFFTNDSLIAQNQWIDMSKVSTQISTSYPNSDSTLKAFTTSKIVDDSLKEIKITTPPSKTSYFVGDNFDKTGMVVTAYYNNGKSNTIFGYDITGGTNMQEGQSSVTITYEDKTVEQSVTVEKNSAVSIQITNPPTKTVYKAGEDFEKAEMVVEATFKDGTTREVTDYIITDGMNLKNGQTTVTISYEEQTTTQAITVEPNPVIKLEIQKAPDKTNYIVGQDFDKTGMIIVATYESGLVREILDYTIENGVNLSLEQTEVIIKFEDQTITQAITVEDIAVVSIEVKDMPEKIQYIQNKENLDLTGGTILVKYNNEAEETILMTDEDVTVTGFNNSEVGKVEITVMYESKTTTFEVTIIEEITAKNSDFSNANVKVLKTQYYAFTDPQKEQYIITQLKVENIARNLENDSCEYYYYLSNKHSESNIQDWVKIKENQTNSNNLTFKVDTQDISNFDELLNSTVLYLYIKEVAIKGGDQKALTSEALKIEPSGELEIYLDDVKVEIKEENNNNNNNNNNNDDVTNKTDNTISSEKIPNAGKTILLIIFIAGIACVLILSYKKFKDFKEIK